MKYPFEHKSTSALQSGHFWALPLSDGSYAACIVRAPGTKNDGTRDTRLFIAGLLDWHGRKLPTPEDLLPRQIAKSGVAHVRSIQRTGAAVLGHVQGNWPAPATTNVFRFMPVWGYGYALAMAERHFVQGLAMEADLPLLGQRALIGLGPANSPASSETP